MIKIAITGGIGSGKSLVCDHIKSKGYKVIDADQISKDITSAGGEAIPFIKEKFGTEYITEDGSMNRDKMRELVFSNSYYKHLLEEGTTSLVLDIITNKLSELSEDGENYAFVDIPLLFETHTQYDYDCIWYITSDIDIRKSRIIDRDGLDTNIINKIINSQLDDSYKINRSDVVIFNNGSIEELYHKIDQELLELN